MTKNVILCADDYAQSPAISQGIINLIAQKRLSATSCLVNSNDWFEQANWLKPYSGRIDIGLHFNLTLGRPLSKMPQLAATGDFPALSHLLLKIYSAKIKEQEIYRELNHQLDQFAKALGRMPDFIDGHQHIHCLPVIRRTVLACYQDRLQTKNGWIRNICPQRMQQLLMPPAVIKKTTLYLLGGGILKNLLTKSGIKHNTSFAGIYNFNTRIRYANLFPLFLKSVANNGLIMCHPGLPSSGLSDPIASNRVAEYKYLASDDFLTDCQLNHINLAQLGSIIHSAGCA